MLQIIDLTRFIIHMKTTNGHARAVKCHAYCRNDLCPQADACVFHRAAVACSSNETFVPTLNLLFYPDSGKPCRFYRVCV